MKKQFIKVYIKSNSNNNSMKKNLFLFSVAFMCFSCSPIYNASNKMMGATQNNLIKNISFTTGCPKENIKIIDELKKSSTFIYKLDVCGVTKFYQQIGANVVEVKDN